MESSHHFFSGQSSKLVVRHRLLVMIFGAITVALFLVGIAMNLYRTSGTAQLDLSRPGYQAVRNKASRTDAFDGFSSTGELDKAAIDEFNTMYQQRSKKVITVDGFGSNALGDDALFSETVR